MAPGTYIRPVGRIAYAYSYEVTKTWPDGAVSLRRWGLEDRRVVDDGRVHDGYSLSGLVEVAPGLWRKPPDRQALDWGPTYYRRCDPPAGRRAQSMAQQAPQLEMFA